MKNKLTETKSRSGIGLTRHLISGVLCLAVISLFCARASAQNLFAVDAAQGNINGSIDEFTPNGVRSTFASGLNIPVGLACDKSGNLFVADAGTGAVGSRAVYKFTLAGVRTTFASGISGSLACDSMGNLFVADGGNILKFTPYGVRSTFASELLFPQGLAFDRAGNLFVAAGGDIYKFTPTGVRTTFAFGLASPFALAFDSMGNLFVADGGTAINYDFFVGAAVYKFTPSGLRSTVASQNDKVPVSPGGLAIDSADNLFVANGVIPGSILKFTPSGVRSTFASGMVTALAFQPTLTPTPTAAISDFNGDGHSDYVLYNRFTRQTAIWYLNNNVFIGGRYGLTIPAGWSVVDVADFDRDGHPDYVLQNANTHQTAIWYLNNNVFTHGAYGPTLPSGWFLGAVGDFNGDGKPDYLLYTQVGSNFPTAIWYMNNNVHVASASGPTLPNGWLLRGVADFNGDGKPDFLLYNAFYVLGADNNNRTAIWYLNNNVFIGGRFGPTIPAGWSVVDVADFDRDGHPDYVLQNFNTNRTVIWYLNNNVLTGGAFGPTLPPASTSSQISWDLVAPLAGGMVGDCAGCWDYP